MYKVMIIDDEKIIREGLANSNLWEIEGCHVVATATNGIDGFKKAQELEPDIIVADINMPKMSGLDMAEKLYHLGFHSKFIIITGFSDFEYARKAIKLSAVDFIQKPISDEELHTAIKKSKELLVQDAYYKRHYIKDQYLEAMRDRLDPLELGIKDNNIRILTLQLTPGGHIDEEIMKQLENIGIDILGNNYIEFVQCHENVFAYVLYDDSLMTKLEKLKNEAMNAIKYKISWGLSSSDIVKNMAVLYDESKVALEYKLYSGYHTINCYSELPEVKQIEFKILNSYEKDFRINFKINRTEDSLKAISSIFEYMKLINADYNQLISTVYDLDYIMISTMKQLGITEVEPLNYLEINDNSVLGIMEILEDVIRERHHQIMLSQDALGDIGEILNEINEKYNEDLSLSYFSEKYYISESSISRNFKKKIGIPFAEYIKNVRMDKAIHLLQSTHKGIQDIALEVGYSDYRYFSTLFKKDTGLSPTEFRKATNQNMIF